MRPDFGNICPNCKPIPEAKPIPPLGCFLVIAAIGAALSVWFFNI